jgi:peptidoglycan hydrolase CwlO-like protein
MKYGHFTDLSNVDTMDKVVTEDDLYIENGTSLRKDIHDFLVASVEKGQKICILENQNRKRNLKNQKKDEEEKRWSAYKKAPGTQTSEKNSETKKGSDATEAQSLKKEEAPTWKATRVPFGLKKMEAANG